MGSENLTPERYRCPFADCPSVHRLDDGRLLIVGEGELPAWQACNDLKIRLGETERAIVIDPGLLEEFLRCQAGDTAAGEDGVAASAALHRRDGDGALDRGLPRQLTIHLCARDGLLHAFSDDVPDFYISGTDADAVLSDIAPVLTKILADNYGKTVPEYCQRIIGDNLRSQIEEPALAGDEVSAASQSASLTPPNQDFEAKAREIVERASNQPVELITAISSALLTASKDATERAARIAEEMGGPFIESDAVGDGYREARTAIASAIRTQEPS